MNEETRKRLAAAREATDARDIAYEEVIAQRKAAILELDLELTKTLGTRGEDFEIVDGGPEGPIAVKLGEPVLYKRYRQLVVREKETQEDTVAFVRPCVAYPAADKWDAIVGKRPHLIDKCASALLKLFGVGEASEKGKS